MKKIVIIIIAAATLATGAFARGTPRISFETKKATERTGDYLHAVGIEAFMAEVWTNDIAAPRIHSLFFVEHLPPDNPELVALETAYRDFGLEMAKRFEELAMDFHLRTRTAGNRETLDWLLRFAKWIRTPGGYENYRISRYAEGVAVVALGRLVADLDEDIGDFDQYMNSLLSKKESATLRANIFYEESFGTFDVRRYASRLDSDETFERLWGVHARKIHKKYGWSVMGFYSRNKELLKDEDMSICFFAEDNSLCNPRTVSNTWGYKQHRMTCVFGGRLISLDPVVSLYMFRKVMGKFPAPPPSVKASDQFHAYHDYWGDLWTPHEEEYGYRGGPAGSCYYSITHDEFMDCWTLELMEYRRNHGGKLPWQEKEQEP